ncbi:MAG: phosphoribosylformylglycinamidine synthase subunit PurQ, partial [Rhizobiales bacterium]|nr:phosphoribosylformylglycinamidine synthase subunit PurQ [Hyphomicrobiales bacterium]
MKSAVILFPGSNRERDAARALRLVCGSNPAMVWHGDTELPAGTDLVVLPGGFSYGDYLRCGAIAARSPIMDAVRAHDARARKACDEVKGKKIKLYTIRVIEGNRSLLQSCATSGDTYKEVANADEL